jgi:putative SOS response-associated peptidase YedK
MCGRIALFTPPVRMARLLEATLAAGVDPEGHASWNVGPTQRLDGVRAEDGARLLDRFRWGLIPSWAKDPGMGVKTFNARAETVASKPSFRAAYKARRLLVPIDGFYEWDRRATPKSQPHFFQRRDGAPLVLAGLWETWRDPAAPEAPGLRSATIITTEAGDDMDGIHDRMPVVLEQQTFDLWLSADTDERDALDALLRPAPSGTLAHHPVDRAVGNIRNDGPELIEPVEPSTLFEGS